MEGPAQQSRSSRSLKRGSPPPPSSSSPSPAFGQRSRPRLFGPSPTNTTLYICLQFDRGPVSQALYAVDVAPPPSGLVNQSHTTPSKLYPVVELMRADYPLFMSFVVLDDSKFYFVGGEIHSHDRIYRIEYANTVYFADAASITRGRGEDPKLVLREVAHMSTGKPFCNCFVAGGKIYAFGTRECSGLTLFEVYDPQLDKWTALRDPPFYTHTLACDVVVDDDMVLLVTTDGDTYSFNTVSHRWRNISNRCPYFNGALGHMINLDNTVFWTECDSHRKNIDICSYGPLSAALLDPQHKQLDAALLPEVVPMSMPDELREFIQSFPPKNMAKPLLHYLGNRMFAFMVVGTFPDPKFPDNFRCGDPEQSDSNIVVFEIPKEEYAPDCGGKTFKAKILHSARVFFKSTKGADHSYIYMPGWL